MRGYLTSPKRKRQALVFAGDVLIVAASFFAAYMLKFMLYRGGTLEDVLQRISWLVFAGVGVYVFVLYIFDLFDVTVKRSAAVLFLNISVAVAVASSTVALMSYMMPAFKLGRVLMTLEAVVVVLGLFLWRMLVISMELKGARPVRLLLLAASEGSGEHLRSLLKGSVEYDVAGVVRIGPGGAGVPPELAEGSLGGADVVVVEGQLSGAPELSRALVGLKARGAMVYDYVRFCSHLTGKVPLFYYGESSFIFSRQGTPFAPLYYVRIKRLADIALSLAGLLLSIPFFLVIPVLIKLTSRGPVLFRHERLGEFRKPFVLVKFRTMVQDAERESGPVWSSSGDPRVTAVGRVLRAARLDELPQFINVLAGRMSFVGPRPIREHFADRLAGKYPHYNLRFLVKPGLTGWAQVQGDYGSTDEEQMEKLEYDLFYIQNRSIFLDMLIVLKTLRTIVAARGK